MTNNGFEMWGYHIPSDCVADDVKQYLSEFALRPSISLEEVWEEMDRVWNQFSLSNKRSLQGQPIGDFYSHPVWILNGFFSALDSESVRHRDSIAQYISSIKAKQIADYGGGFGELAMRLANYNPTASISIIEPFPSELGKHRISEYSNISYLNTFEKEYDALVVQDVLEHVEDPIELAAQLSNAVSPGGYLVFANCFFPYIKCHLPKTFHLRHTFPWVMNAAGLQYIGTVSGATHAQIFKKVDNVHHKSLRKRERYSKLIGPLYNSIYSAIQGMKIYLKK